MLCYLSVHQYRKRNIVDEKARVRVRVIRVRKSSSTTFETFISRKCYGNPLVKLLMCSFCKSVTEIHMKNFSYATYLFYLILKRHRYN